MAGRTAPGPIRGPASSAAGVSPGPSPRLPPPTYQRPGHLRQAPATLALRLLLRGDRRHDLLGHHDPQPPRRVDPTRHVRQAQTDRVGVLRPVRRPRPRSHRCGRLHHQGARRQRGRRPVTGRPRQTGPETLRLEERGFHGRIAHKGENAPIQASSAWARGAHPRLAERLLPARPLLRAAGHRHRRLLRSRRAVRGCYDPAGCDGPRLRGSYEARPVRAGPWQRAGSRGGAAKSEPGGAGGSIGPSGMQGFGN